MKLPINYTKSHWSIRKQARLQYIEEQQGLCYYCKKLLTDKPDESVLILKVNKKLFPPNFFEHPVHLHHNHTTGLTIGAVHAYCNAVLWQYEGE